MVVDPGDWLPRIAVGMLAGTTAISIAGAYVLGRYRRREIPQLTVSNAERPRMPERVITPH